MILPSEGCQAVWTDSTTVDFVNFFEKTTSTGKQVWADYNLGDGPVVLYAGKSTSDKSCLGLWHNGKVKDYAELEEAPKISTQIYGYYLNYDKDDSDSSSLQRLLGTQPIGVSNWLKSQSVKSAVLMPTDFPDFPFTLTSLLKTQIAIHESFHVEIMLRYWFTQKGAWPGWDQQPDRASLQLCYNANEQVKLLLEEERQLLVQLVDQLLSDGSKEEVCKLGNAFLAKRKERYETLKALKISVKRGDNTDCDCAEAENIMELEEGLADYGSWTILYEIGMTDKQRLLQRYGASQAEPFYLTGAALMHALTLIAPESDQQLIQEIANSENSMAGSVFQLFEDRLATYCSDNNR